MTTKGDDLSLSMRQEWDDLSRKNAFHYIASLRKHWPEEEFLCNGEFDTAELVDPFLSHARFLPSGKTMLEIGCGVGRMTFALAKRFARVNAIDVSGEMVKKAKELQRRLGIDNIEFRVGNGRDLREYPAESMDFCFSYIVFQHIPDVSVILGYITEIGRVLKRGGLFQLQLNGYKHIRFPNGYYLLWGICATHRLRRWNINRRPHIWFGKLDGWHGVPVTVTELRSVCDAAGLTCTQIIGVGRQFMWVSGYKST